MTQVFGVKNCLRITRRDLRTCSPSVNRSRVHAVSIEEEDALAIGHPAWAVQADGCVLGLDLADLTHFAAVRAAYPQALVCDRRQPLAVHHDRLSPRGWWWSVAEYAEQPFQPRRIWASNWKLKPPENP